MITDREILEQGQARELYRTWETTKQKVLTTTRVNWLVKIYGKDGVERITGFMKQMNQGNLV